MPDLRDSFDGLRHDLDATQAPDMLADAFDRTPSMGGPDGPSPWRRAGIIALALMITVASTVFVISAFDRDRSGPAAGTGVLPYPLAYAGADSPDPDWSHGHLWLMDEAGQRTTLAPITDQTAVPAWSPDGSQIAFATQLDDVGTQIWVINADGTGLHEVTRMVPFDASGHPDAGSAIDDAPAWSPDGTKIAFNCYDAQGHQVCVVNADGSGSGPQKLTDHLNVAHDTPPVWVAPNELMFSTAESPGGGTYTLSLGRGELTRIGTARRQMTISPDRQSIAFVCDSYHAICTESVDLTHRQQVTSPGDEYDEQPSWLPDGRLSFLRSDQSGTFDGYHLYVVDAHGGDPTELVNLGSDVRGLGWGPSADQSQTPGPTPQSTESSPPGEAGYWIRFPDQMSLADTGFSGSVVADTNLPDGTLYAASYESGSSGNTCCPAVNDGHVRIQIENSSCFGPVGGVGGEPSVAITFTVAPHPGGVGITAPLGPGGSGPNDEQPADVIDILGKDFQDLSGEQVQPVPDGSGNELVATRTYQWPEPQCGGDPLPLFGGPTCHPAREQLQGDTIDDAMVEVVGALGQARMCEFWGTELTEATEASHPWDAFSTEWRQWFLDPPKDFSPSHGAAASSSIQTFSPGQTFTSSTGPTPGHGNGFSSLDWTLVSNDGTTSIVDITSNGTPILELTIETLRNYCPDCSPNTVPFWGVTDWRFLDS